jgi:hypothetical protein
VLHLLTSGGYGYFRDELYYLACTENLAAGYVDHPPFSVFVLWLVRRTLGDSLPALRLVPALLGAATVVGVYRSLPPEDRAAAWVLAPDYGVAGAVDLFGRRAGLPPALSGHNSYWLWGPRGYDGRVLIVIGGDEEELRQLFARVDRAATLDCGLCMPYENGRLVWVARGLRIGAEGAWEVVKHYD